MRKQPTTLNDRLGSLFSGFMTLLAVFYVGVCPASQLNPTILAPNEPLFSGLTKFGCIHELQQTDLTKRLFRSALVESFEARNRYELLGKIDAISESTSDDVRAFAVAYGRCIRTLNEDPELLKKLNEFAMDVDLLFARLIAKTLAVGEFNQAILRLHSRLLTNSQQLFVTRHPSPDPAVEVNPQKRIPLPTALALESVKREPQGNQGKAEELTNQTSPYIPSQNPASEPATPSDQILQGVGGTLSPVGSSGHHRASRSTVTTDLADLSARGGYVPESSAQKPYSSAKVSKTSEGSRKIDEIRSSRGLSAERRAGALAQSASAKTVLCKTCKVKKNVVSVKGKKSASKPRVKEMKGGRSGSPGIDPLRI